MSTRTALRGALLGAAALVAMAVLVAPVAPATAAPATVPLAHKTGLPADPLQAPLARGAGKVAPAVSKADAAADNGDPPLRGGGRASVLWILGGVVAWAGVIVARGLRRPVRE